MNVDYAVNRVVPSSDYLFVLIYANARTGVQTGEEDYKVIGAYGRDIRVSDSKNLAFVVCGSQQACPSQHVLLRSQGMHASYIQRYLSRG